MKTQIDIEQVFPRSTLYLYFLIWFACFPCDTHALTKKNSHNGRTSPRIKTVLQIYNLNQATWNIRKIQDKTNPNRPKRRISITSKELQKYNIDIVALNEVRFTESGNVREKTGHAFYWDRKTLTDRSVSGVAFAVKNGLLSLMSVDPKPVNDRLVVERISNYQPTQEYFNCFSPELIFSTNKDISCHSSRVTSSGSYKKAS